MKRMLIVLGAVLAGLVSCVSPVEPHRKTPTINDQGKAAARQLVFALKTLRTYHDVSEVAQRFDFSRMVQDTPSLDPDFWDPEGLGAAYSRALAKHTATRLDPVGAYRRALARSLAPSIQPPQYDSTIVDSLLDTPPDELDRILASYPEPVIAPPWTEGYDSLFARIEVDGDNTLITVDSVRQYRSVEQDGLFVEDRLVWDGLGSQLLYRDQRHSEDRNHGELGLYLYRHVAHVAANIIADRLWVTTDTSTLAVVARREDGSSEGWWSDGGTSLLIDYHDTLYHDRNDYTVRTLVDSIGGKADGVVYDFAADSSQPVRVVGRRVTNRAEPGVSEFDFVQSGGETFPFALTRYQRVDRFAGGSIATVTVAPADSGDTVRSVSIVFEFSESKHRQTSLGTVGAHRYLYTVDVREGWGEPLVLEAVRVDSMVSGGKTGSATWSYRPETPMVLEEVARLGAGRVSVTVAHAGGDGYTRSRTWTLEDTGKETMYEYIWAGLGRDTIRLSTIEEAGAAVYEYRLNKSSYRRGSVSPGDTSSEITDSLALTHSRYMSGHAATDSSFGMIAVTGVDSFTMSWSSDTIHVAVGRSASDLPCTDFLWVRSGGTYVARLVDENAGNTYRYTMTVDAAGAIEGVFDGPGETDGADIRVGPTYRGTAHVGGMSRNTGEPVTATLSIALWGTSTLGGEYSFH